MSRRDRPAKRWFCLQPGPQNPIGGGGASAPTYTISGDIVDGMDAGIEGVLVTLSGDKADTFTTESDGAYSFTVEDGSYTVTPTIETYDFTPTSRAAEVSGDNVVVDDMVGFALLTSLPAIYNFEADTIGDTGTILTAKDTHFNVNTTAGASVQLQDYSTLKTQNPTANRITKCFQGVGNASPPWSEIRLGGDLGFLPSDGGEMLLELVTIGAGTNQRVSYYIRDAAHQEGINLDMYGNSYHYCKTISGGVSDASWKFGPYGIGVSLANSHWYYHGWRYNFANNQVNARCVSLDGTFSDTGWVTVGTVNSPSFNPNVRLQSFFPVPASNTTAIQAFGQFRIANWSDGANDGVLEAANYRVP